MNMEVIEIGKLYNDLLSKGYEIHHKNDYELIIPENIKIHTFGDRYVKLIALSRHKTNKHLIKITCKSKTMVSDVIVTTDHICMIYNDYNFFENKAAKDIQIGDIVALYDENKNEELKGVISKIEDLGTTEEYVYDCEVDDESHAYYASSIYIHNSQFISIKNITETMKVKYNLPENLKDWTTEDKLRLWEHMDNFVRNDLNVYVQNLAKTWCHTEQPESLTYALEYIADNGLYESKKHYAVHKVLSEGPEIVDKIKYSGIELKKAAIPKKIKEYLGEIYSSTLTKDWNEENFKNYILEIYPEFEKLDINDISIWKGYNTGRNSTGFLQMEKGTTGIAKAVTFYNQLISKQGLNIASKYDTILLGDKVRFCYIKPTNKFKINVIAFKDGQYPDEFREIFQVDYETMFDKLIASPLKNFLVACKWKIQDPNNCNIMDVDDL